MLSPGWQPMSVRKNSSESPLRTAHRSGSQSSLTILDVRRSASLRCRSRAAHRSVSSGQQQSDNVDAKIEQAMDLVKAHLMYAVHEELHWLRAQIGQLELKVLRLEAENVALRQHAPAHLLHSLCRAETAAGAEH